MSHAGRGDGAAALRPLHCAVHGSGCVSPCISSTALAPFSSAELRQWGVIAHVPPPIFLMSTAPISWAAKGNEDRAGLLLSLTETYVWVWVAFSSHHQIAEFERVGSLCWSAWLHPARGEDTSVAGRDGRSSWRQAAAFCSCGMTKG